MKLLISFIQKLNDGQVTGQEFVLIALFSALCILFLAWVERRKDKKEFLLRCVAVMLFTWLGSHIGETLNSGMAASIGGCLFGFFLGVLIIWQYNKHKTGTA